MGPPDSHRISRVPRYSGYCYASNGFVYRPITVCGGTFQNLPLTISRAMSQSYNPAHALRHQRFGLFPGRSPLLGESLLFSLPTGTKMFQFPAFASSIRKIPESLPVGCPIRKSAHQGPFAPPRGLSQLIASFIACKSLGIHRTPFLTCYASFLSLRKECEKRVLKVYFWLTPFRLLYVFIFTHSLYQQGCATIRVRFSVFTDLLYSMS